MVRTPRTNTPRHHPCQQSHSTKHARLHGRRSHIRLLQDTRNQRHHSYRSLPSCALMVRPQWIPSRSRKVRTSPLHKEEKSEQPPTITLPTCNAPDHTLQPQTEVKWIGVILDRKLDFQKHIKAQTLKAEKALGCLRMLANTQRGLSQSLARQLYQTCILPIMTYASPVWWKGEEKRGSKTTTTALERVQRTALRWICGAFKTIPVRALEIESSIMPIKHKLNQLSTSAAIRLLSLHVDHPVAQRLGGEWRFGNPPITPPPLTAIQTTSQA